ncbi:MAG: methyltransferase [Oceanicaulis sp.]
MNEAAGAERFFGGRIVLRQDPDGYRAGLDAALLAAAVRVPDGGRAAEFGCGAGAALLSAASLNETAQIFGIERDRAAAALARENTALNAMTHRVSIIEADAMAWREESGLDAVFFNPPFFDDPAALRAPKPGKTGAYMNEAGLAAWIEAGLKRLKEGGVLTVVHRADRLGEILGALTGKAGDTAVLGVHPRPGQPAKRVLVAARKTARAPMRLLAPLVLHPETGSGFTEQARAVLEGRARLALHP